MTDLRARITGAEGSLQKLTASIPGFAGYRELGLRRKADQLVREHLVGLLDDVLARAQQVVTAWADAGKLDQLDPLDRLVGRLRLVRDQVRFADYGYSGWFDAVKIKEPELDALYDYDLKMREEVVAIDSAVQDLATATDADLTAKMAAVGEQIERLKSALDHRGEITANLVP
ncbi:MAG TPA: hypothetical protein VGM19_06525 [Armatimonadota bacterium]|jgi:hypothetical protein